MSTKEIIKKVKEKDIVFIWILVVVVTILFLFIVLTVNEKGSHQDEAVASMSQYSSLASDDIRIGNIESKQKVKNGFEMDASGKKYYLDGELVCNGWISDNGHRYFADRNGKICTGKYIIDDTVYILKFFVFFFTLFILYVFRRYVNLCAFFRYDKIRFFTFSHLVETHEMRSFDILPRLKTVGFHAITL